jgi:mRNA interferase RelE/StbE
MQLVYSKHFLKDIKRIRDADLLARIEEIIDELKQSPDFDCIIENLPIKKLVGSSGYYRLRIQNYRLGIFIHHNEIRILRFGHRKDFYEGFP